MLTFEKLDARQQAVDFVNRVYEHTRPFPSDERFGLTNQCGQPVFRSHPTFAEGSSRISEADFARFVEIATGSLFEVVSQATVAKRQGLLDENNFDRLYQAAEEQGRMQSGLRRTLLGN